MLTYGTVEAVEVIQAVEAVDQTAAQTATHRRRLRITVKRLGSGLGLYCHLNRCRSTVRLTLGEPGPHAVVAADVPSSLGATAAATTTAAATALAAAVAANACNTATLTLTGRAAMGDATVVTVQKKRGGWRRGEQHHMRFYRGSLALQASIGY
jgi:hypothetical protein